MFFCRSSESSSGGSFLVALAGNLVALAGNGSLFSPRHVTGVNAAANAAVSTSARSTVARIIAVPFDLKGHLLSQNRTLIGMEAAFEQGSLAAVRFGSPAELLSQAANARSPPGRGVIALRDRVDAAVGIGRGRRHSVSPRL